MFEFQPLNRFIYSGDEGHCAGIRKLCVSNLIPRTMDYMSAGGLKQFRKKFWLDNGASATIVSCFGQNNIYIDAPVSSGKKTITIEIEYIPMQFFAEIRYVVLSIAGVESLSGQTKQYCYETVTEQLYTLVGDEYDESSKSITWVEPDEGDKYGYVQVYYRFGYDLDAEIILKTEIENPLSIMNGSTQYFHPVWAKKLTDEHGEWFLCSQIDEAYGLRDISSIAYPKEIGVIFRKDDISNEYQTLWAGTSSAAVNIISAYKDALKFIFVGRDFFADDGYWDDGIFGRLVQPTIVMLSKVDDNHYAVDSLKTVQTGWGQPWPGGGALVPSGQPQEDFGDDVHSGLSRTNLNILMQQSLHTIIEITDSEILVQGLTHEYWPSEGGFNNGEFMSKRYSIESGELLSMDCCDAKVGWFLFDINSCIHSVLDVGDKRYSNEKTKSQYSCEMLGTIGLSGFKEPPRSQSDPSCALNRRSYIWEKIEAGSREVGFSIPQISGVIVHTDYIDYDWESQSYMTWYISHHFSVLVSEPAGDYYIKNGSGGVVGYTGNKRLFGTILRGHTKKENFVTNMYQAGNIFACSEETSDVESKEYEAPVIPLPVDYRLTAQSSHWPYLIYNNEYIGLSGIDTFQGPTVEWPEDEEFQYPLFVEANEAFNDGP